VGKYYVAGIPFDSENSLKHYGVKGMEWNKHKFGLDADTRFIKWIDPNKLNVGSYGKYGKMAEAAAKQKYGAAAPKPQGKLAPVYNKQSVMDSRDSARRNMAQPWGRPANNQIIRKLQRQGQIDDQVLKELSSVSQATQQRQNVSPLGKASNFIGQTAKNVGGAVQNAGKAIGTAAGNVGNWAGNAAQNVGNFFSNQDEKEAYEKARAKSDADPRGHYTDYKDERDAYLNHPVTKLQEAAQNVKDFVDYDITGKGYGRDLKELEEDIAANPNSYQYNGGTGYSNPTTGEVYVPKNSADALNYFRNAAAEAQNNSLFGKVGQAAQNVGNTVGQAARNVGNAVSGAAQNVANSAPVQAVGDWTRGAAQKAADVALWPATREDVANVAQNVGNVVSGAAQNVGNWVGDRVQDVRNAVSPVAQNVSNAVGQATKNVGNTVSDAANKASEGTKGFLNSAGQWVNGATNNVKNTASKAVSDASKGASGFLNSAGKWVSNATGNVGKAAQDAGKAVSNAAQNVSNTVGQAAEQARGGIGGFFDRVGNAVGSAANAVGDWAGNAAKDVGNAVGDAAQNVGNWAGQAAQDVGDWIGDQAQGVSGAAQNAVNAVANAPKNIANWYTGNNLRKEAQNQRELGRLNQDYGNNLMDAARNGNWNSEENRLGAWDEGMRNYLEGGSRLRAADQYMDMYNNAPRQKIANGIQDAASAVGQAARNVGGAVSGAANAVGEWVGDRVSDARDAITAPVRNDIYNQYAKQRDAAYDEGLRKYYETGSASYFPYNPNSPAAQAIDQAWDQREQRMNQVNQHPISSSVGYAAGNVADWARNAAGNVGNAVGQASQWLGNVPNAIGQIIPEQLIPEQLIPEQLIREKIYHSALNEKPDGVSDAFWEKFTADGGTREEYERDWR